MIGDDSSAVLSPTPQHRSRGGLSRENAGRWDLPLLASRPGGMPERFAAATRIRSPVIVFLLAAVAGLVAICAASVVLGFLVTDLLLDDSFVRSTDEELPQWLADNRSGTLSDFSYVGSEIAGRVVLPALVGVVALVFAYLRKWRAAAFAVFVLVVESATYRVTSLANARERPHVPRLEDLPADASYPSGHTAAAVAVYAGLVLLISSRFTNSRLRAAIWAGAITIVTFVAMSRMYRGMHHPIDVIAGLLLGCAAIAALVFACRAAAATAQIRDAK
ncbi:MAG TPA: phosphatase PAP2 family protein [Baekduia sp.]|nr:phosphatase PAP2 family protein [Baekduia sp.]